MVDSQAQTIWDAIRETRSFDRCPVIYQHKQKPLLYTLHVDGRILIAWPNLNVDRLDRRLDLHELPGLGVTLPRQFGRNMHALIDLSPAWLDDEVDVVPLFSFRGSSSIDTALLPADAIREDVRANLGRNRRIGLSPPEEGTLIPTESRVLSAAMVKMSRSFHAQRNRAR